MLDVDGTLIDSNEDHAQAWVDVGRELGYTCSTSSFARRPGMRFFASAPFRLLAPGWSARNPVHRRAIGCVQSPAHAHRLPGVRRCHLIGSGDVTCGTGLAGARAAARPGRRIGRQEGAAWFR